MNLLHSTSKCALARTEIERIQRDAYVQLALPLPDALIQNLSPEELEEYLKSNPDYAEEARRAEVAREMGDRSQDSERADISAFGNRILAQRVDDLKLACRSLQPSWDLDNICFGTVPGGGLDAYTTKVRGADQYAIVLPEGLFNLVNLLCKLVERFVNSLQVISVFAPLRWLP